MSMCIYRYHLEKNERISIKMFIVISGWQNFSYFLSVSLLIFLQKFFWSFSTPKVVELKGERGVEERK